MLYEGADAERGRDLRRRDERPLFTFAKTSLPTTARIPFLLVMEHLSKTVNHFRELMKPYTEGHFMSGGIELSTSRNIKKVIAAVKEQYAKDGKEDFTDGYSLEAVTGASIFVRQTPSRFCA